jgi:aryl-alcohol dehydrogenase-like predicted oxidoreductase
VDTIRRLARALDEQDWDAVRGCLGPELDTDYSSFRGTPPARLAADAFIDLRRDGLAGLVTEHLTSNHSVELDGDRAICRCEFVIHRWPANTTDRRFLHSYGTYAFALRHVPEGWQITGITQVVSGSEGDPRLHGALRGRSESARNVEGRAVYSLATMEGRALGRTGLRVSALGFGCGNIGGLMIRGAPAERERAVARALELGVNYFDTAPLYGDGQSEQHLGQALRALRADAYVGTKVRLAPGPAADMPAAIVRSLDDSLRRLGMERVDLIQLHNRITTAGGGTAVAAREVRETILPTFRRLVEQGKARACGITALGDTAALLDVLDDGAVSTAQVCHNLLNPTAAHATPPGFPAHDFGGLLARCGERNVGAIVIRVLAGGALSGDDSRHPLASPPPEPIASGPDYAVDVARARILGALVKEGLVESLVEASLRFVLASPAVSTVLLGHSSLAQLEYAAACVARGPLPDAALARLRALWEEISAR